MKDLVSQIFTLVLLNEVLDGIRGFNFCATTFSVTREYVLWHVQFE